MDTIMNTDRAAGKGEVKKCSYCEFNGIVHHAHYLELGEEPLLPCPRCVIPGCRCGGQEPYYYIDNGKIQDCSCREARMRIEKIKKIYNRSGIDRKFQWKFLGDFDASRNRLGNEAKNAAYEIVRNFPDVRKGLFLWGNPGTGKTLLSSIMLTEIIARHAVEGRFVKISRNFFNRLKATFHEASETYGQSSQIEKEVQEVDILVIDDFGVQRDSPWEQETLYNLVDARYEAEKFTVFTSNLNPLKAFKDLSEGRILSRIKEMCHILELSGEDFRNSL